MLIEVSLNYIQEVLAKTPFFSQLSPEILTELSRHFEPVFIESGNALIREGDEGDSLYLVLNGRLRSFKRWHKKSELQLNDIGSGELIGELALLTGEPRVATVVAIRDSILLKLPKNHFLLFVQEHPLQLLNITKQAILRLLNPVKPRVNKIATIAILPAGSGSNFKEFAHELSLGLNQKYPTLLVANKNSKDFVDEIQLVSWLCEQEQNYNYVIYICDEHDMAWTKLCLRQADQVISVAHANANPQLNKMEDFIYQQDEDLQKGADLILIHAADQLYPQETNRWLRERNIHQHHHLKEISSAGIQHLIRYYTGKAVGLVLGGGGARGLAHIGALKALHELKIPIDYIAGTSAGSMIGALIAQGKTLEEIKEIATTYLANNKALYDYTLPIISLLQGKSWHNSLVKVYGKTTQIEDLWIPFFCVSTNISKNELSFHNRGLLWKAIRASISLPGIVPPVSTEEGDLLIDGGVVNTLPVDLIQKALNGGKVIAISASERIKMSSDVLPEGELSGWHLLYQRLNLNLQEKPKIPNIGEIILESINLAGATHRTLMAERADCFIQLPLQDFGLFDFKALEKLVEVGYQSTLEKLKDFNSS